jgi:predicted double-glycine peptidase
MHSVRWLVGRGLHVLLLASLALGASADEFSSWVELRDRGVVRQANDFSCGLAALATVLGQQFGIRATEADLLETLGLGPKQLAAAEQLGPEAIERINRGVSMATLSELAAGFGVRALGVSVSMEQLTRLRAPAIAYIEAQGEAHFTVIRGIGGDGQVQLADPSWGNRLLSRQAFAHMFLDAETGRGKLLLLASKDNARSWFGISRGLPVLQAPPMRFLSL